MPKDSLEVRFGDFIEGLDGEDLALIVHEALNAIGDDDAAVAACVDWADISNMLEELHDAVVDRMSEPGPEPGPPPGIELPEEALGAGDPELEETAAADLNLQLECILFEMYRRELIAEAEDANDRPGPGSRTLLTEPPSLGYNELAVLRLIEIVDASKPGKLQWLVMLTPAGQLRAHRIAEQRLALLAELEDGDDNEGHPS